ncbi:Putative nucleoside diphosphate kinase [Lemmus lemmus]
MEQRALRSPQQEATLHRPERPSFLPRTGEVHEFRACGSYGRGFNVVRTGRMMLRETNPADYKIGTIQGNFYIQVGNNSVTSAGKETSVRFKPEELIDKFCAHDRDYK